MEKLFTPGKWFVGFCAVFVCIFMVRNYVHNAKIEELSKLIAQDIFDWQWPARGLASTCEITESHIVKADENSATVTVKGVQKISQLNNPVTGTGSDTKAPSAANDQGASTTSNCQAQIKLYRQDNHWQLGSVEVQ